MKTDIVELCECVAHTSDEYQTLQPLIEIEAINDDSGNRLASTVIQYILKAANIKNI